MPRPQQGFNEETAAARQRLIEQLQQLSKAFQDYVGQNPSHISETTARLRQLAVALWRRNTTENSPGGWTYAAR